MAQGYDFIFLSTVSFPTSSLQIIGARANTANNFVDGILGHATITTGTVGFSCIWLALCRLFGKARVHLDRLMMIIDVFRTLQIRGSNFGYRDGVVKSMSIDGERARVNYCDAKGFKATRHSYIVSTNCDLGRIHFRRRGRKRLADKDTSARLECGDYPYFLILSSLITIMSRCHWCVILSFQPAECGYVTLTLIAIRTRTFWHSRLSKTHRRCLTV